MIAIPDEFSGFVRNGIASGRFRTEEEAVAEGLRLLRDKERKLDALRGDLVEGIQQLDNGERIDLCVDDIKKRGRERLQAAQDQAASE